MSAPDPRRLIEEAERATDPETGDVTAGLVDNLAAALRVALARAEEAENYAKEGWAWLDDALDALGVKTVFDIKNAKAGEKA